MRYANIPEEELKTRIGQDYFSDYDFAKIIGKVDFCVLPRKTPGMGGLFPEQSLLWAEAKAGSRDVVPMFAQLILTIGKARTFSLHLPPAFLGVFDAEKIAFVPYDKVQHLFFQNDFNWNVAPSDHGTKEFDEIKSLITSILEAEKRLYHFGKDDADLKFFIKNNLAKATTDHRIPIDRNNFVPIYLRWLDEIKPLIDFDFASVKGKQILDSDFYLADLFVDDNDTRDIADDVPIKEGMFVVFREEKYEITKENLRAMFNAYITLKDKRKYQDFWSRYKRPPIERYWDYIIERRDLLVPQDVRERKGAFFTPKKWVELSQKHIADVLGEDWQEEYYVWDCAAGTGNLLVGLVNRYNLYASTLDQADVNVIQDRIKNGANLVKDHVFQFDFLNDAFFDEEKDQYDPDTGKKLDSKLVRSKLPESLQDILRAPEKRKKLVIYINPPYAEAGNRRTVAGTGENKPQTANSNKIHERYGKELKKAGNELFAQFLIRIYREIPGCKIANFSKLKPLLASNFSEFRKSFRAKLEKVFLMPADTFDNVKGQFPIGFFVWDGSKQESFTEITADVYDEKAQPLGHKNILSYDTNRLINQWIVAHKLQQNQQRLGFLVPGRNDFQHVNWVHLVNTNENKPDKRGIWINDVNLTSVCVYLTVHHCIAATWLNDRDQFLYPNDSWEGDKAFHYDCLAFALFHGQNRISVREGINHWIPFTEKEVNARERFASRFMSDFIAGKIKKTNGNGTIFEPRTETNGTKCRFSPEAKAVFDAGRELWRYYHSQKDINTNASLYDIREYFQGRSEKGTMNATSADGRYTELIGILREKLNILAEKIAVKVYEHGFLRG